MLEVVFSDSEKGSMKAAKNYDMKNMLSGTVGYIGKKPKKAELQKLFEGKAIGGSSSEVVNIGFNLDIGDISGEIDGKERKDVFRKLWGIYSFDDSKTEDFFERQRQDLIKLKNAASNGKTIRIWKSNAPYSTCGFYYVCYILKDIDCDIRVVELPEYKIISEKETVYYSSWGEVSAGKFYEFLPLERKLSLLDKKVISDLWRTLIQENSPLRTNLNGRLISVPENFYDSIITNNIPESEFIMARFIGKLIGDHRIGVGDSWYALRIEKMIKDKLIILVEDKDKSHPYAKVLRRKR
ncbi:MAG: DUF1835 domain-containing protein [Tissierellales bacterium]|nr:DUF1835 domain-containing protein [Tissierellales bacterium]